VPRRFEQPRWALLLVAAILVLDLTWALVEGSTGSVAYGLIDEPAHLATCALALIALRFALDRPLPAAFVLAALLASVAIDLDHLPGYLGSHLLSGSQPRPYSHSLLAVAVVATAGYFFRKRPLGLVLGGVAFGIAAHLLRDLATGPGVSLFWPFSGHAIKAPYVIYAALLGSVLLAGPGRRWLTRRRESSGRPLGPGGADVGEPAREKAGEHPHGRAGVPPAEVGAG
jgi:inner membrane protein